jgi:hypothetical protein
MTETTETINPKIHSIPAFHLSFDEAGDIASVNVTRPLDRILGSIREGDLVRVIERYLVYTTPTEQGVAILRPRKLTVAVRLNYPHELVAAHLTIGRMQGKDVSKQLPGYTEAWMVPAKNSTVSRGIYRVVSRRDEGFYRYMIRLTLEPATDMQDDPTLHDDRTIDDDALTTTAVVDVSVDATVSTTDDTTDDITDGTSDDITVEEIGTAPTPDTTIRAGEYYWFVRNGRAIRTRHRNTEEDRRRVEMSEAYRHCPISFGGGDE